MHNRTLLMLVRSLVAVTVALAFGAAAVPSDAQAPPQPPTKPHRTPGARTLPSSPNDAVSKGLSLEQECLNAVGATRHSPQLKASDPSDDAHRAVALEHLDAAEEAARAGHGQVCEDELASASENLK